MAENNKLHSSFHIIFDGDIQKGQELDEVKARLCALFRTEDTGKIDSLFRNTPKTLKKNLSRQQALKYQQIFEKTGACCRILQERTESETSTPQAPQAPAPVKAKPDRTTAKSLGTEAKPEREAGSGWELALFFGAIPLVIGVVFLAWSVTTLWKHIESYTVYETGTCTIESKRLVEGDDTYRPHFEFAVRTQDGERYSASGYSVDTSTSSGRSGKEAILARFEIGESYTCWYRPDQPTQAVLTRNFPWLALVPMAFGLPAFLIGVFVIMGLIQGMRKQSNAEKNPPKTPISSEAKATQTSPAALSEGGKKDPEALRNEASQQIPSAKRRRSSSGNQDFVRLTADSLPYKADAIDVVGSLFALISFGGFVMSGFHVGKTVFILTVVLWILFSWRMKKRQSSIPKHVVVELSQATLWLGSKATIRVYREDKPKSRAFQLRLQGKEKIFYRSGTDTNVEEKIFHERPLNASQETVEIVIPSDAVPSFTAPNNRIQWNVLVEVNAGICGTITLEFPFQVISA